MNATQHTPMDDRPDPYYMTAEEESRAIEDSLLSQIDELVAALRNLIAEVEQADNPIDQGVSRHCQAMVNARAALAKVTA